MRLLFQLKIDHLLPAKVNGLDQLQKILSRFKFTYLPAPSYPRVFLRKQNKKINSRFGGFEIRSSSFSCFFWKSVNLQRTFVFLERNNKSNQQFLAGVNKLLNWPCMCSRSRVQIQSKKQTNWISSKRRKDFPRADLEHAAYQIR